MLPAIMAVGSVNAEVIFFDSFEDPVVPVLKPGEYQWVFQGYNADGPWPGWVGGGLKYAGVMHMGGGLNLLNVSGNQVIYTFNNLPGEDTNISATTTVDSFDVAIAADTTYSLTLKTASTFMPDKPWEPQDYHVQLMAIDDNADPVAETVLAEAYGPVADNDFLTQGNQISMVYRSGGSPVNLGERLAVRLRKGNGVYFHNVYYDDVRVTAETMNVSPFDGAQVPYGPVDLSWDNLDPNEAAPGYNGNVYVDILWSDDPNNLDLILDGGENATTHQVTAVGGTTYYWQIISYLEGDSTTSPQASAVYSFTALADLPVNSVGILPGNMITWSEEPVQLNADVDDDGNSDLTYEWSCDLEDGVVFSATDIANPTITITKDPGVGIVPLANAGFEEHVEKGGFWWWLNDGERDSVSHPSFGWSTPNWGYYYNGNCGIYNPNTTAYAGGAAAEGRNVGYVDSRLGPGYPGPAGGLWQNTNTVLKSGVTYTLSVKVGNPLYNDDFPGYRVQLVARGGSLLAEDNDSIEIAPGTFETSTITFTCPEGHADIGKRLRIQLFTKADMWSEELDPTVYEVHFDDVKLTNDDSTTIQVTLAAKDAVTPPLTDTITIDIYDTACQAAIIGKGIKPEPGDFNIDCVTNNVDLDELAGTWLNDSTLTEPAVQVMSGGSGNDPDDDPCSPDVDAGSDWRTWSGGGPVTLNATVVNNDPNDPQMALTYAWTADAASLADPNLTITITNADQEDATVEITKAMPTGNAVTVTLTLTANNVESEWPDAQDSMTIDVYDGPCEAAITDPADANKDCITNLKDFALMALDWLSDVALTAPVVKP